MDTEFELFKGKNFRDLCQDIYANQENRKEQIEVLIAELRPLVKKVEDAMIIVPLIKDYLNVSVANDEHLVRLAGIIQKIMAANANVPEGGPVAMTEAERKEIMAQVDAIKKQSDAITVKKIKKVEEV
jgi:hypothetical protein